MRRTGVWGDNPEVMSLEEAFGRQILIYSADAGASLCLKTDFSACQSEVSFLVIYLQQNKFTYFGTLCLLA
jgi:hypothetical protein